MVKQCEYQTIEMWDGFPCSVNMQILKIVHSVQISTSARGMGIHNIGDEIPHQGVGC